MTVFAYLPLAPDLAAQFRSELGDQELALFDPSDKGPEARSAFLKAEVAFGGCPADWVAESTKLRWLQLDSIGVDAYLGLDWNQLSQRVTCTNLRNFFTVCVAETALAGILAMSRELPALCDAKPRADWCKDAVRGRMRTLSGSRVLLLGYGSIGRQVRALCEAFGARCIAFGRPSADVEISTLADLDRALPDVDIVVASLPDTPDTRNLLHRERLAQLPAHAIIVNVGRSGVLDEAVLIEALQSNRLGAAVLDVTAQEPLPVDHPLWRCPNVLLTQHTAGGSAIELHNKIKVFTENFARYVAGEPLENVVDWQRGY